MPGVLIACMTSHAQAQDRVRTIITGRDKATVLKNYSGTDVLPKPQIVLNENFRMTGDVMTEAESTRQHHLLHKRSQPLTRHQLISAVQKSFSPP
jgi:hypothetical protein